ncbi:MAG TPA: TVP38/TMEM64 family protein [Gemmatimonadota bacterium]|nr:TVP38/TMEM64 family protein [Gemmatimonadota bacterium]
MPEPVDRPSRPHVELLVVVALAVAALAVFLPVREWLVDLLGRVERLGAWAAVVLGLLWIPVAILLVPGSLITLGTGFLLGVGRGMVTVSIGSTLGALAAFLVGRTVARERVRAWIADRPRFRAVDRAVEKDGLGIVLLTRLSPLFPYNFLNYAYGLTGIRLRDYALGSWVGMLPGTLLYVVLGSTAQALTSLGTGDRERTALEWVAFGVGLLATVAVTWVVARRATAILEERTGMETDDA